ncbi:peptidoglycan bridge formation glycyltransferase FemA/FemB family protein [Candidatus Saccharibacteria bacterium]|nr:peptidoglycan bridge formation glycyltransferase FemA/FemB family protein [Candidatus Saccharibacteria bacterium]
MEIPITQSEAWHHLQSDLGGKSFFKAEKLFQYLAILKTTPVGNYLYCPYGPVADGKSSFLASIESLKALAKENQAIFIRIEPLNEKFVDYFPKNTKKSPDLNPKETWILDLTGNDDEFKNRLPSRLLRYHKSAQNKGITIEKSHRPGDIKHLLKLQKSLAEKKGINTFSEKYLETELKQPFATLYLAKYQNPETNQKEIVAAGLVFDDETRRYNLQGAQSDTGRSLHATGILTIQLILDAREKGLTSFDFWGIAPEGAPKNHPWAGFTAFKKTFVGEEVKHAGTYDIVLNPVKYKIYQATRKINRLLRKNK